MLQLHYKTPFALAIRFDIVYSYACKGIKGELSVSPTQLRERLAPVSEP